MKQSGLTLVRHGKEEKEYFQNLNIYSESQQIGHCDWVIIATKTTVNNELAGIIEPMVGENTAFLTLQNGMGNVENLMNSFGANRVVVGGCVLPVLIVLSLRQLKVYYQVMFSLDNWDMGLQNGQNLWLIPLIKSS